MKKNFWLWAFGDVFTKIAGGIFGGSVVALYYNEFVLTQGKTIELLSLFWLLTILSIPLAILGYFMIKKQRLIEVAELFVTFGSLPWPHS